MHKDAIEQKVKTGWTTTYPKALECIPKKNNDKRKKKNSQTLEDILKKEFHIWQTSRL